MVPDPSFQKFLEEVQKQNSRQFGTQLLQLKYEREIAGEDDDRREAQLNELIEATRSLQVAITGTIKVDFSNAEKILTKQLEELSLTRKLTEGSVEYDKEMAQYRNTSGRDVESLVSGKTSKTGQVIDFETASDRLSGQGKRVRESERNQLNLTSTLGTGVSAALGDKPDKEEDEVYKTFGEMVKDWKDLPGGILKDIKSFFGSGDQNAENDNAENDNVESVGEKQLKASEQDLELSKDQKTLAEKQVKLLDEIRSTLDPSVPEFKNKKKKAETDDAVKPKEEDEGGSLTDLLPGKKTIGKALSKAGKLGKAAGRGLSKLASSPLGKIGGAALAVGAGAYTAITGYNEAEDNKQAKLEEVQKQLDAGEIDEAQAAKARNEIGNTATIEKSAAVGEGTGMAGGAIAGAATGAALGSVVPVVGTAIGGLAGGAIGAFAGSKAGKWLGEKAGGAINSVGDWFSEKKKAVSDAFGKGIYEDVGVVSADQEVTSNELLKEVNGNSKFTTGITSNKSVLGSTGLGAWFTEKGKQTGSIVGTSSDDQGIKELQGSRYSGGLFGADKYKFFNEKTGQEEDVNKDDYFKIQSLVKENKIDEAIKLKSDAVARRQAENLTPLGEITGETPDTSAVSALNENANLKMNSAAKPTPPAVVSNNVTNTTKQSFTPVKAQPRSTSTLDRYQDRVAAY